MNKALLLLSFWLFFPGVSLGQSAARPEHPVSKTRVTVLSEGVVCPAPGLRGEHGFCVLIEKDGRQYLYDAGGKDACLNNMKALGKDIARTEKIFISHGHSDHVGGLDGILKAIGHPVEIVAHPDAFGEKYSLRSSGSEKYIGTPFSEEHFEHLHKDKINFQKVFFEVAPGMWLTGEVPRLNKEETVPAESFMEKNGKMQRDLLLDDNSLVLDTEKGLVIITACGHSGVVNILKYVKSKLKKNIYALIGGMHLDTENMEHIHFVESELARIFSEDHTRLFAPNHCTGKRAIRKFRGDFKGIIQDASCGAVFVF